MTLTALLRAIGALYDAAAGTDEEFGEDLADIRRTLGALSEATPASPNPASRTALGWLPAGDASRLGEVCRLARSAAGDMPWHYSYGDDGLVDRIAFADLVGPTGPFVCSHLRLGLTLVAPQTLYPMHAHPARELYLVLSGRALWTAGTLSTQQNPGAFVFHPSGVAHAMQTAAEPLLALYSWRGDIMTPPYYTDGPNE